MSPVRNSNVGKLSVFAVQSNPRVEAGSRNGETMQSEYCALSGKATSFFLIII